MKLMSLFSTVCLSVASFFGSIFPLTVKAEMFSESTCAARSSEHLSINESHHVTIGGIKQWIVINGTDCKNPVVLIIHGGPGNPSSVYSKSMYRNWEREFTIVHWDQRGSGKTFEANQQISELTPESLDGVGLTLQLLVDDGVEVTDYLRKKFSTDKIIISGASWGAALALNIVHQAPEKYYFYVGLSQLVNYRENMKVSYELVMSKVLKDGNKTHLDVLQSIGAPPWADPKSFGKLRRIIRYYENQDSSNALSLAIDKEYLSEKSRIAYEGGEDFSYVKFVGLNGDGMAQNIALDKCCTEFKVPIYLIQGDKDLLTAMQVTERYFRKIKAPAKKYIKVDDSGHDPNLTMLNAQLATLRLASKKLIKRGEF